MLCTMYLCDAANMYKYIDYTHMRMEHRWQIAPQIHFFMEKTTF